MGILALLLLVSVTNGENVDPNMIIDTVATDSLNSYGFIDNFAIPLAEAVRKEEESVEKIVGGSAAELGQFPYQALLLAEYENSTSMGLCGGSLVSPDRVITAAHCWNDGNRQASRLTVILGTIKVFSGGTRIQTTEVAVHPDWQPNVIRNDVAVVYLPHPVEFSDTISPIALPSGSELEEDFAGESAVASGFGLQDDGVITKNHTLNHVSLNVISNFMCSIAYPTILEATNICTSSRQGFKATSTCQGDSGGPLALERNDRRILIGVTSFGHRLGCKSRIPAGFSRVTSFMGFFNEHIKT